MPPLVSVKHHFPPSSAERILEFLQGKNHLFLLKKDGPYVPPLTSLLEPRTFFHLPRSSFPIGLSLRFWHSYCFSNTFLFLFSSLLSAMEFKKWAGRQQD